MTRRMRSSTLPACCSEGISDSVNRIPCSCSPCHVMLLLRRYLNNFKYKNLYSSSRHLPSSLCAASNRICLNKCQVSPCPGIHLAQNCQHASHPAMQAWRKPPWGGPTSHSTIRIDAVMSLMSSACRQGCNRLPLQGPAHVAREESSMAVWRSAEEALPAS